MGDRAEYIKMSGNGPNALDFHIAFYIGKISEQDPTAYFHIISKDKGFDPLIQHLKNQKIFAARSEAISEIPIVKNSSTKSPIDRAQLFAEKLKEPKVTKPRTAKTLASSIKAHFQPSITEDEISLIIDVMQKSGFISIDNGKIIYKFNTWLTSRSSRPSAAGVVVDLKRGATHWSAYLGRYAIEPDVDD